MTVNRWIGLIGALLLVLGGRPAMGQSPADAYFHEAARQYVAGNVEAAAETVERGLEAAPSDPRLQALLEKLEQNGHESGGGGSSRAGIQGQGEPQQQSGANRERDREDQGRQTSPTSEEARSGATRRERPGSEDQMQRLDENPTAGSGTPRPSNRENRPGNVLSRAQANRLLQALEIQEKTLLRRLRVRDLEQKTVEKDW